MIKGTKSFSILKISILKFVSNFDIRISDFIFYLILLFLPTQLGRHFWPSFSLVQGIRVDYLSPTVYFTDVLIMFLFISHLISNKFSIQKIKTNWILFLLIIVMATGILFAKNPLVGVYGLIKLLEFVFLGFYLAKNITLDKKTRKIITDLFAVAIIFEASLAIFQFIKQESIGGIFYYFGERFFDGQTPGIANASLGGHLVLRPYGTLPHPNVLAGYLTIAMAIVIFNFQFSIFKRKQIFYFFSILLGTAALLLTMGRIAIGLWLVVIVIRLIESLYNKNKFTIYYLLFTILMVGTIIIFSPLQLRFTDIKITDESITDREALVNASIKMIKKSPLFGVGINNYLVELPYLQNNKSKTFNLQPVHNIYLLIASETGIIGLICFLWFIKKTYQKIIGDKFTILSIVLIIGLLDHYFLTVQQGRLLFTFILGFCYARKK